MSEDTKAVALSKTIIEEITDGAHAPFIFFDAVNAQGLMAGLVTDSQRSSHAA